MSTTETAMELAHRRYQEQESAVRDILIALDQARQTYGPAWEYAYHLKKAVEQVERERDSLQAAWA